MSTSNESRKSREKMPKDLCNIRSLRLSLKYRPKIFELILRMRNTVRTKNRLIFQLKQQLNRLENLMKKDTNTMQNELTKAGNIVDIAVQTELYNNNFNLKEPSHKTDVTEAEATDVSKNCDNKKGWVTSLDDGKCEKSIAEQVKEVAQGALQQSGMVYVESAGMYYDYKTGYYYNTDLGLYYHTDTGCYYYYSEENKTFAFHSYPDTSAQTKSAALIAHEKRKARKNKKVTQKEDIENLTKNLSQDTEEAVDDPPKPKRKKYNSSKSTKNLDRTKRNDVEDTKIEEGDKEQKSDVDINDGIEDVETEGDLKSEDCKSDLEDGECSESEEDYPSGSCDESDASTVSDIDNETVAKHHPPSMRVIVKETNLAKLKVGNLFLVTKDGGSVGREGDHHIILIKDPNVSRHQLDIKYDMNRRMYSITDVGSKNGTMLNGVRMSESQVPSQSVYVQHGSTLQLGETKLLCHIHPGNDTCGHCEPGLIMECEEKEKKAAYTRTCSVQRQHKLELARLKNAYAPAPLMIESGQYNDRAKARRDTVGSSHHSEKTQAADCETSIASENKGYKLLEKMGWSKGEGLGKEKQGDTDPIPLVSNDGKAGLGSAGAVAKPPFAKPVKVVNSLGPATLRLASKTKMLQPPAKAFQLLDDDDSE